MNILHAYAHRILYHTHNNDVAVVPFWAMKCKVQLKNTRLVCIALRLWKLMFWNREVNGRAF